MVVKEFSLDEENSALSRLVANVDRAQRTITRENFRSTKRSSALARMKRELSKLFNDHRDENQKFQEEVKLALQSMAVRKQVAARNPHCHGIDFEADRRRVRPAGSAQRAGDVAEATGSTRRPHQELQEGRPGDRAGPGKRRARRAKIVVEAKEVAGYQLKRCANRDRRSPQEPGRPRSGLFIFSRPLCRQPRTEPLSRASADDLFIVWDREDAESDLYLKLGLSVARALAVRHHHHDATQTADFRRCGGRRSSTSKKPPVGLEELQTSAEQVGKHGEEDAGAHRLDARRS